MSADAHRNASSLSVNGSPLEFMPNTPDDDRPIAAGREIWVSRRSTPTPSSRSSRTR